VAGKLFQFELFTPL